VLLTESVPAGVLALWVLVTHVMYMQDYWRTWLRGLRGFFFVGALFSAVSVSAFCTFLALAITQHQSEDRPGKGGRERAWMACLTLSPLPGLLIVEIGRMRAPISSGVGGFESGRSCWGSFNLCLASGGQRPLVVVIRTSRG
jgi:hypothetical protein